MGTKVFAKLLVALCLVAALAACSDDGGDEAGDGATPDSSSPSSPAATTDEAICVALAEVNENAQTLQADLPGEERDVLGNDVSDLDMSISDLITALQNAARAEAEQVQSAWDDVKTTFSSLSDEDVDQIQEQLQPAVGKFKTALDDLNNGVSC
jgi:hypothetical protein